MANKYILAELINFRGEQIFERLYEEKNEVEWTLSQDESLDLPRGIYDLYIYVGTTYNEDGTARENEYKKLTARYEIVVR